MQNNRIKNLKKELLSDNWYRLDKVTYDFQMKNGEWESCTREAYDRGNGATILLYNEEKATVVLTKQFRLPTYLNGNPNGFLIETCGGLLDNDDPETCIKKEAEEETGYRLRAVKKVFEAYMSPGSVTEIVHFFIAEYTGDMKVSAGGGLKEEQENIEVIELPFGEAYHMIETGKIRDGKTIMLLQYLKIHHVLGA